MAKRLFDDLHGLLQPETLSQWVDGPVNSLQTIPLSGDHSGSNLFQIKTNGRQIPSKVSVIPCILTEGWALLQAWIRPETSQLLGELHAAPSRLGNVLENYPRTLVHGDYRPANLAFEYGSNDRAMLLDWQLAGYTLPTIDLCYFLNKPEIIASSMATDDAAAFYRMQLEVRLGQKLASDEWRAMLDLGELIDTLRMGTFQAWGAANVTDQQHQAGDVSLLQKKDDVVRRALEWF